MDFPSGSDSKASALRHQNFRTSVSLSWSLVLPEQDLACGSWLTLSNSRVEKFGTSSMALWLRHWTSDAGAKGSIPGWGTKIPHAMQMKKWMNLLIAVYLRKKNMGGSFPNPHIFPLLSWVLRPVTLFHPWKQTPPRESARGIDADLM